MWIYINGGINMWIQSDEIGYILELLWSQIYHDTVLGSDWLKNNSISPGGPRRWAVGYNFLYTLYRILNEMRPKQILEIGLGQSTKLTGQYADYFDAKHLVVEHDLEWTKFFCKSWKKYRVIPRYAFLH